MFCKIAIFDANISAVPICQSLPSHVDLNLIYTFHVFVEQGSVVAAARALFRSQPTISARLHQLEEELEVRLFERIGRRLHLTPVGRSIYRETQLLLESAQRVIDCARSTGDEVSGGLRIASLTTVGQFVLAPILLQYTSDFSNVTIDLSYKLASEFIPELLKGDLDLVAGVGQPPEYPQLLVSSIGTTSPVLVGKKGTFLTTEPDIDLKDLGDFSFVNYGKVGDPFFDSVSSFLKKNNLDSHVRYNVSHIQTLKTLISSGEFVGIIPDYTVVEKDLDTRHLKSMNYQQEIWVSMRRSSLQVPIISQLFNTFSP